MAGVSQFPPAVHGTRIDPLEGTDVYLHLPKLVSFFLVSK
jgi:hypothetical protein